MVKQGNIINAQLNPTKGHEQQGYRPCVGLSNEIVQDYSNIIIVAPISNKTRDYPLYYKLENYKTTGKILIDQIRAIDSNARDIILVEDLILTDIERVLELAKMIFDKDK